MVREANSAAADKVRRTPVARLRRIEAVVNAASGSVGRNAARALQTIVESFGLEVNVANVHPPELAEALIAAVSAKPDLLIVLAGDGTARLAAELCGPDGPLVAPLPGGTMNMLPHAIYGALSWRAALEATLERGEVRPISGGEIDGCAFYVAAILGAPALWADAREAVRAMKFGLAVQKAQRAYARAFARRLRFDLGDGQRRKAEALTLMCPLVSRAQTGEEALEADTLDPHDLAQGLRLGLRAAMGGLLGDWRKDPSVTMSLTQAGSVWTRAKIPALLDGEPHSFPHRVQFRFNPVAFRALAPPPPSPPAWAEAMAQSLKVGGG